jgi:hypothetical protein
MNGRMGPILRLWLIVWGVLALIALGAPGLVAVAMFLIVPGLILVAAPTVFLYSAFFAIFRHFFSMRPGLMRDIAAALSSLMLGWVAALPGAAPGRIAFARANLPEIRPAFPVKLAGTIRLELPKFLVDNNSPEICGPVCAELLDTPGIKAVALVETAHSTDATPTVYRLVPRAREDRSRSAYPVRVEAILDELPSEREPITARNMDAHLAAKKRAQQAVAAAWGLRLATDQKLLAEKIQIEADQTIRVTEDRGTKGVSISRIEILDQRGKVLLRRSIVSGRALAAPLRFDGIGGIEGFHIELAHDRLANAPSNAPLEPIKELFLHSSLAPPKIDPDRVNAVLDRLRIATGNPALSRDDPDFALVPLWLPTIDWAHPIPSNELDVLARLISDERIPVPTYLYYGYESKVAPELRGALGSRILHQSTPPQIRTQLARLLSRMPSGTFSTLSAKEEAFLFSPDLRLDTYPMIVRLADQGEAAVPRLFSILETDKTVEPNVRRERVMHAAALAFAALGPSAHAALPKLDAIISADVSGQFTGSGERELWNLALARMGKPINDFTWPEDKPQSVARNRESLNRQVQRFDPKNAWQY